MNEERIPFLVRMRASLKARIEEVAKREHRSTNQQIEFLLEQALAQLGHAGERDQKTSHEIPANSRTESKRKVECVSIMRSRGPLSLKRALRVNCP